MTESLLFFLILVAGAPAWGDAPTHYCFQSPMQSNLRYEAGYLNCDLDKSGKTTPQNICLEGVSCMFITPAIKATIESEAAQFGETETKLENMNSELVGKIMLRHVYELHEKDFTHPSTLVCKFNGARCQTVDECQGALLYNIIQEGSTSSPENQIYDKQQDGQIVPRTTK